MSHPDPKGPPDRLSIKAGEVWENPVNRERLTILERPWDDLEGRAIFEMTALVGARVVIVPISWYPRLSNALPEHRWVWEFIGGGHGIHWLQLDEDIIKPRIPLSPQKTGEISANRCESVSSVGRTVCRASAERRGNAHRFHRFAQMPRQKSGGEAFCVRTSDLPAQTAFSELEAALIRVHVSRF